jgi:hypothetical protein
MHGCDGVTKNKGYKGNIKDNSSRKYMLRRTKKSSALII